MFVLDGLILLIGMVVSVWAARRLSGEAQILGAYFAGLAAAGLLAGLNVAALEAIPDGGERDTILTHLAEVVGLGPFLGVLIGPMLPKRSPQDPRYGVFGRLTASL